VPLSIKETTRLAKQRRRNSAKRYSADRAAVP
jgi:hypothetical protein